MNNLSSFSLKTTNAEFTQRQKNVFDQLKVLENNRKNSSYNEQQMETDERTEERIDSRRTQRAVTKHFRGKESIFKKPQNPVPKNYINRIPDFKKNPHKWTRYSLDDVKDEDMSDKGNTKAALSFLKELKERRSGDMECDEAELNSLPTKITFNKYTSTAVKPKQEEDESSSKPSFRSSKIIMPEYVVGQKAKKEKRNRNGKVDSGKELKLDHLLENEDEDE